MSELNRYTALTLRAGIMLGLALIVIGLFAGDDVLWWGMLILIASPLAGVVVTLACLLRERDMFWASVAVALIIITAIGIAISILRRRSHGARWNP